MMSGRPDQLTDVESLTEAERSVVAPPCAMVIFGAAGDLTKRLVVPALYNLVHAKRLPDGFRLVGVDLAAKVPGWNRYWVADLKLAEIVSASRNARPLAMVDGAAQLDRNQVRDFVIQTGKALPSLPGGTRSQMGKVLEDIRKLNCGNGHLAWDEDGKPIKVAKQIGKPS